jgi:ABC-type Fe3+/spermidine/putrescine transport system ATPase subunit
MVAPEDRGIGIVFQDLCAVPHLTVAGNVAFGLQRLLAPPGRRVARILEMVDLADLESLSHELSGRPAAARGGRAGAGARARADAARRALLESRRRPRAQMRDEVEKVLRTTGTTAIFVTHDQEEAFTLADRVARA